MIVKSELAFSVSDIVVLMETCKMNGITEFSAGGLSLKLVNDSFIRDNMNNLNTASRKSHPDTDQLLIEDPLAFEEALMRAQD
jgi:hypothetical protein